MMGGLSAYGRLFYRAAAATGMRDADPDKARRFSVPSFVPVSHAGNVLLKFRL